MATGKAISNYLIQATFAVKGTNSLKQASRDFDVMAQSAINLGRGAFNIATQGLKLFVNGLKDVSKQSIKVGADFENAIYTLGSIMGEPVDQLGQLSGKARELGASTLYTASEAAQGMQMLARAGLDAGQVIGVIGQSLEFAGANMISMDTSTKIVTSALKQFSLQAGDAERVTDTFTIVAQNSLYSVEELATSFRYGGSVAAGFGASVEETASMLAQFRNLGLEASMAGVRFRQSMLALSAPTYKAKKALEALGIDADTINPRIVGLRQAFENLGKAGLKADDLVPIVNKISAADVAKISGQIYEMSKGVSGTTDDVTRLMEKISEMRGRTAETYDIIKQSTLSTFKILKSNFQEFQITLFDTFTANYAKGLKDNLNKAGVGFIEIRHIIEYVNDVVTSLGDTFKLLAFSIMDDLTEIRDLLPTITADEMATSITTALQNTLILTKEFIKMVPILKDIGATLITVFAVGKVMQFIGYVQRIVPILVTLQAGLGSTALMTTGLATATKGLSLALKGTIAALTGPVGIAIAVTTVVAGLNIFNSTLKKGADTAKQQANELKKLRDLQAGIAKSEQKTQQGVTKSDQKKRVEDLMKELKAAGKLSDKLKGSLEGLRNIDPAEAAKETGKYLKTNLEINGKMQEVMVDSLTLRRLEGENLAVTNTTYKTMKGEVLELSTAEANRIKQLEVINSDLVKQRDGAAGLMEIARSSSQEYTKANEAFEKGTLTRKQAEKQQVKAYNTLYAAIQAEIALGGKRGANAKDLLNTFNAINSTKALTNKLDEEGLETFDKMDEAVSAFYKRYQMGLQDSTKNLEEFTGAVSGATTDMIVNKGAVKATKTSVKELNSELKKLLNQLKKLKDFRVELRIDAENKIKILRGDLTQAGADAEKLSRKLLENLDLEIEKTKRVQKLRFRKFQKGGTGGDFRARPLTDTQQATFDEAIAKKTLKQYEEYLATFQTLLAKSQYERQKNIDDFEAEQNQKREQARRTEYEKIVASAEAGAKATIDAAKKSFDEINAMQNAIFEMQKSIADEVSGSQKDLANATLRSLSAVSYKYKQELNITGETFSESAVKSVAQFESMIDVLDKILRDPKLFDFAMENPLIETFTISKKDKQYLMSQYKLTAQEIDNYMDDVEILRDAGFVTGGVFANQQKLQDSLNLARELQKDITKLSVTDIEEIEKEHQKNSQKREMEHQAEIARIKQDAVKTALIEQGVEITNAARLEGEKRIANEVSMFSELLSVQTKYQQERKERIKQFSTDNTLNTSIEQDLIRQLDKNHARRKNEIIKKMYEDMGYIDAGYYDRLAKKYSLDYSRFDYAAYEKTLVMEKTATLEDKVAKRSGRLINQLFVNQFSQFVSFRRNRLKLQEDYYDKVAKLEKELADRRKELSETTATNQRGKLQAIIMGLEQQRNQAETELNVGKAQGNLQMLTMLANGYAQAVAIMGQVFNGITSGITSLLDFFKNAYSTLESIISTFTGGFSIDPMSFLEGGTQAVLTDMEDAKKALEELERRYAEGTITAEEYQEALAKGVGTPDAERAIFTYFEETVDKALMFIEALGKAIPSLLARIRDALPRVLNELAKVLPDVLSFFLGALPLLAKNLISFIINLLPSVIQTLVAQIPVLITRFTMLIYNNIGPILNTLKKGLFDLLDALFKPAEQGGRSVIENLLIALADGAMLILESVGDIFEYLVPVLDRLFPLLANLITKLVEVFLVAFTKFNALLTKVINMIVGILVQAIIGNLDTIILAALAMVFQATTVLVSDLIQQILIGLIQGFRDLFTEFLQGFKEINPLYLTPEEQEAKFQKRSDFWSEVLSLGTADTETYGDTPQAIKAGTNGLTAKFAPGDYIIAAQNPANLAGQAMELLSKGATTAVARGLEPMVNTSQMGNARSESGYQNLNISINADGKILDSITVNAMDKGTAPRLKRKIRRASGVKTGFDRGSYNRY